MKDFFISYNRADRSWAEWIAWNLESAGYSTVLQAWDFRPGSNFALEMHSSSKAAERTIAVLSPDYLTSPFTMSEWAAALVQDPVARSGKLLPVRVRDCVPTGLLQAIVYIDLVGLDEAKAKEVLLAGVQWGRQKPAAAPSFPGLYPPSVTTELPRQKIPSRIRLLHLSDLWIGFTKDQRLCEKVLTGLKECITDEFCQPTALDGVLITGDIAFSAKREEYAEAHGLLSDFFGQLEIKPLNSCYLVPGNHDVNWGAIGPAEQFIVDGLSSEEQIARVLSHAPTMELLSARLESFCDFTTNMLGKSRAWRRDRPWRVDVRHFGEASVAFLQLNAAWTLGPQADRKPILGEYQVREALSEAGDCDFRIWLCHYPIGAFRQEEASRICRLLGSQDATNLFFRGTRHAENETGIVSKATESSIMEFSAGPMFPGPVTPSCSFVELSLDGPSVEVSLFKFHGRTQSWVREGPQQRHRLDFPASGRRGVSKPRGETPRKTPGPHTPIKATVTKEPHKPQAVAAPSSRLQDGIQTVSEARLRSISKARPVLILSAVEVELMAVLERLKPWPKHRTLVKGHIGQETYYGGKLGSAQVVATMCAVGSIGRDAVILSTQQAISHFNPKAIIMVGIAFGKSREKQRLGDVLVASQIISYEQERVGKKRTVHRGTISQTGPVLLNRFRQALDWRFKNQDGEEIHFVVGPMLSGEKLVDNAAFKRRLFEAFPQAVGGEMEGAGLYAVASRFNVEWIVVKGICDWADGSKTDDAQPLAASAAASLVEHVLAEPAVLDAL